MTELQSEVLNKYRESISENHEFVNTSFLDYIFNKPLDETSRRLETKKLKIVITEQLSGTNMSLNDVFKSYGVKGSGRGTYILRGMNDLLVLASPSQWTDKRICFIEYYYPNYPIPGRNTVLPSLDRSFAQTSLDLSFSQTSSLDQSTSRVQDLSFLQTSSLDQSTSSLMDQSTSSLMDQSTSSLDQSFDLQSTSTPARKPRISRMSKMRAFLNSGIYRHGPTRDFFWTDLLVAADKENRMDELLKVLRSTKDFAKKLTQIPQEQKEQDRLDILLELQSGNAASMLLAVRNLHFIKQNALQTHIPNRRTNLTILRKELESAFNRFLKPERTRNGFRVDLVEAVRFVLFNVYGIDSFVDVNILIWGDGYLRGKKDATRLIFAFLNLKPSESTKKTKYSPQSSIHTFTFACYLGKDSRLPMETNLGDDVSDYYKN